MLQTARSTWAKRLARPEITMHFFIIWSILKGALNYEESSFLWSTFDMKELYSPVTYCKDLKTDSRVY